MLIHYQLGRWGKRECHQSQKCFTDACLVLCSLIYCSDCTAKSAPLTSSKKPVRVCDKCFADVTSGTAKVHSTHFVYSYFKKGCRREWRTRRMSNGGCMTERNCGYAIWNAKFHKLRSPCVKMNTPTVNICLRVLDSKRLKKLTLFLIERRSSFLRMNGLLSPTLNRQSQQI